MEASESASLFQMSALLSPSPSAAVFRYELGRNCGLPIAPAQEPVKAERGASPRSTISSAAISSLVNRLRRRLRSEEHTSELQSLMRISYAVFCLKKKNKQTFSVSIHLQININQISINTTY